MNSPGERVAGDAYVLTGERYRESLRDGRRIVVEGESVDDVTTHRRFRHAVDTLAGFFDAQYDPETRDVLTLDKPESGERFSTAWLVPRSLDDLVHRREALKVSSTHHTFGMFGRPPDYGSTIAMGYLSPLDRFEAIELPVNIKGGTGSLIRAFAWLPDETTEEVGGDE